MEPQTNRTPQQNPQTMPGMNQQQDSRTPGNPYGVTTNKFWDFIPATGDKPPELLLYGAISSQQSWWEDRVTPQQFNQELAALGDVPEIIVRINSGGGDVFAANAIFTRLKDCSAKVTVKIDGWAASAATIIAMAGDTIKIARNGVFMIHDPAMTVWDTFRAEDFLKMADELKVIKQSIVNTYASKTGKKTEDIEQLMSNETWWTGDIAVENGFCDELMFEDSTTVVENSSKIVVNSVPIDVSMFKSIPTQLLNSPHNQNPGSLVNSATEPINKPKEKEEPEMAAPENKITTVDALKAAYPDLVATIQNEAAATERARIKGIEDLANTNWDRSYEKAYEKGVNTYVDGSHGGGRTATGSGPVTWNHDGSPAGIADLCGNCWEWVSGMRIVDGEIQIIPYGNAMKSDCNMGAKSTEWKAIKPDGTLVAPGTVGTLKIDRTSASDATLRINTSVTTQTTDSNDTSVPFKDTKAVSGVTIPQILIASGLYPDAGQTTPGRFWARNNGERLPIRGSSFGSTSNGGAGALSLNNARSGVNNSDSLRSALVE